MCSTLLRLDLVDTEVDGLWRVPLFEKKKREIILYVSCLNPTRTKV
jgi:hypothetical protein